MQVLSHEQLRSSRQVQSRSGAHSLPGQAHTSMPPPSAGYGDQQFHSVGPMTTQQRLDHKTGTRTQMLPPPTPQPLTTRTNFQNSAFRPSTGPTGPSGQSLGTSAALVSRRFIPSTPSKNNTESGYTTSTPRRFVPQQIAQRSIPNQQSSNRQTAVPGFDTHFGSASASAHGAQQMPFTGNSRHSIG